MAYRERGFVTVSVALPQQKLTNATVIVKVAEGRLAAIYPADRFDEMRAALADRRLAMARLRLVRVPHLLAAAVVLAGLALVLEVRP